jgi:predicted nucleic acid-binding protein
MNIVLDSNILFSALIKDSLTRRLILEYEGNFLFPSFIFIEMERHKLDIVKKSGMRRKEFDSLLQIILSKVLIVPSSTLHIYKKEATKIVKDIDINDVLFIACALAYSDSIIWSDDGALKKQNKVKVLNTSEIKTILE